MGKPLPKTKKAQSKVAEKVVAKSANIKQKNDEQLDMLKLISGDIKGDLTLDQKEEVKFTRARMLSYNRASVFGGFPVGVIFELHGPNGGGKTALGIEFLVSAQQAGHLTSFHDHERAANDIVWIKALGLDLKNCLYRNKKKDGKGILTFEDSAEEINESIMKFRDAKEKGKIPKHVLYYILVDSVAKMVPSAKLAKGAKVGDANYGLTARLMSDWLQTLVALIGGTDVGIIFINQERTNVGAKPWEQKFKSFGGEALQFDASIRIRVAQAGEIKEKVMDDEITTGRKHRFKIEKNKFGYPAQEGMFFTSNGLGECELGFDDIRGTIEEAILQGIINKDGAYYDSDYFSARLHGERQLRSFLRENPTVHKIIKDSVYQMILEGKTRLSADNSNKEDNEEEE
jgi:recombination protein RecA